MINLSEIFLSIQGETSFSGYPCIFIRFAGCNLNCSYCDTNYARKTEFQLNTCEIIKKIENYQPVKLCSITGGEPLLQTEVYSLLEDLHQLDYQILLETNGSLKLDRVPQYVHKIVDIKCPGSGNENSFLKSNLGYINTDWDEIKFVISSLSDYEWAVKFMESMQLMGHHILFSPVINELEPCKLAEWILSDKLKVRMQLQMHKQIWTDRDRGI